MRVLFAKGSPTKKKLDTSLLEYTAVIWPSSLVTIFSHKNLSNQCTRTMNDSLTLIDEQNRYKPVLQVTRWKFVLAFYWYFIQECNANELWIKNCSLSKRNMNASSYLRSRVILQNQELTVADTSTKMPFYIILTRI